MRTGPRWSTVALTCSALVLGGCTSSTHHSGPGPGGATQAVVLFDGRGAALNTSDGYVEVDLKAGETAHLHYPLPERITHYEVGLSDRNERATGFWRGETLVKIDPPGRLLPLYERAVDLSPVVPAKPAGAVIPSL